MPNRIHFLNTGYSDCIILESDGHFAMVDAAEDTDYPEDKPFLNLPGYEDKVIDYINRNCSDKNGNIHFDFILATHCHSDHIGGFDTVIKTDNVSIDKAYLKPYHEENITKYEQKRWDNTEVYTQMKDALIETKVPIIESFDRESFELGSLKITFFNGEYVKLKKKTGENRNSVVTLVEYKDKRVLLSGDMDYLYGGEQQLAGLIGKVDVLKVGHHGYLGSTSFRWVKTLNPEIAIICNFRRRVYPDVMFKLKCISKSKVLCTADVGGVLLDLEDSSTKTAIN